MPYDPDIEPRATPELTLYYTEAYASEWAPNGETEREGFPIQMLTQAELDARIAALDPPMPTPTPEAEPTQAPTTAPAHVPVAPEPAAGSGAASPGALLYIPLCAIVLVILAAIAVAVRRKRRGRE